MPTIPQPSQLINCSDLSSCFQTIYNFFFAILVALAFLYFLYGAFQYLLSGGGIFNKEQAKSKMKNSIIALIVVLIIPVILNLINPGIFQATLSIPKVEVDLPELIWRQPFSLADDNNPYSSYGITNGVIRGGAIEFGEAYKIAKCVAEKTGVRPAFLLAILWQESNLGANVGSCTYRQAYNESSCPSQFQAFYDIVSELNLNIEEVKVSCGVGYPVRQCGGAMGPAQIMPNTWKGLKDKILAITNRRPPSPWNFKDSFLAAGLYLSPYISSGEQRAAAAYFGVDTPYYWNPIQEHSNTYQEWINALENDPEQRQKLNVNCDEFLRT